MVHKYYNNEINLNNILDMKLLLRLSLTLPSADGYWSILQLVVDE